MKGLSERAWKNDAHHMREKYKVALKTNILSNVVLAVISFEFVHPIVGLFTFIWLLYSYNWATNAEHPNPKGSGWGGVNE